MLLNLCRCCLSCVRSTLFSNKVSTFWMRLTPTWKSWLPRWAKPNAHTAHMPNEQNSFGLASLPLWLVLICSLQMLEHLLVLSSFTSMWLPFPCTMSDLLCFYSCFAQLDQLVIDSAVEKRELEHKHALIQQRVREEHVLNFLLPHIKCVVLVVIVTIKC